ncbi:MAG: SMC family ATPase [Crenarchaeota archaeon]|nr:MAG: SMC family ATPase [Thermoproteota archaeon]RDJ32936.1 MAG: SMC family ATPase [Thermoproteota archaeon]RDJ35983.1 MAG: SMC family ATPase [Thermoproteota archaeon]RDJ38228.1 MAG: SMC family ATPase [Thermoproteota archaeon]
MIRTVEIGDFLSHSDTKLNFENGVTVFVGHNGAGKSSVIDAITFALFGQHTRKSNKGLVRRGQNQGFASITFTVGDREYRSTRKIDTKGTMSSQFLERKEEDWIPIAEGERKQFGESMTKKIESAIGLDFEKLKIASIVQQGELNSIIKAKPKEFKELINAIIGIDKLDISSEFMKEILKNFRHTIKTELNYDDTQIDFLKNEVDRSKEEVEKNIPLHKQIIAEKEKIQNEIKQLKEKIERDSPKLDKIQQLNLRKDELVKYAKDAILSIQKDITQKERKISECEGCFDIITKKNDLENVLKTIEESIEDSLKKIEGLKLKIASLNEQESIAKKLHLDDGKCPVCDSKVDHLNPLFQEEHLREEINRMKNETIKLEKDHGAYTIKKNDFTKKIQQIRDAETILRTHSITSIQEISQLKQEVQNKRSDIQKIPLTINSRQLVEIASIDSHSKQLYEKIHQLEEQTKDFDFESFKNLKNSLTDKEREGSSLDQKLGAIQEKIRNDEERISKTESALKELNVVKQYIDNLVNIQNNVFSRDGPVATSLRSWALDMISLKASEYLSMLNTKIQRIELSEKARDVSIICYSKTTSLDLESLSGGEQVSIALALRLGMTQLLGTSNLNFVILDEPTMHLDEERRRSLVKVLSQLSEIGNLQEKVPMQFIIITHDAEIFQDSAVEQIFRFESSNSGTVVTAL